MAPSSTCSARLLPQETFQRIDGFGANINPVGHWRDGALRPVLDLLVDDLGARLFRLDPFGDTDFLDPSGDLGRDAMTAEHRAAVYRSRPFREAWGMARYLTSKGAEVFLNVAGAVPRWMYGDDGHTLLDVEAYADHLASLAKWARDEEGVRFRYFGALNETDLGLPEGPLADPETATRVIESLAARFAAEGLGDVRFVAADQATYDTRYVRAFAGSAGARQAIGVAGMHCYGDFSLAPVADFLAAEDLDWRYWLTEFGDLEQTGECEFEVALACARRLLRGLADGVRAAMVWDAYDNWHQHDRSWTIYGILRTANNRYTPKRRYHALRQVYRFVPPGSVRVGVAADGPELPLVAFLTDAGDVSLVGLNDHARPARLEIDATELSDPSESLRLFVTDPTRNVAKVGEQVFSGGVPSFEVPPRSVFTITSLDPQPTGVAVARSGDGSPRERS